jgi:Raf kinase inhibitor-like YbhB/YbcL family protein
MALQLTSTAFENGVDIPVKHTCDGEDVSPPLRWEGEPDATVSFALIMEDPDAPNGTFTHWIVYNMPPDVHELEEGIPLQVKLSNGGQHASNDFGKKGYGGPCPPKGEEHTYIFRIIALKKKIPPESIQGGEDFYKAVNGLTLGRAEYKGTYRRK